MLKLKNILLMGLMIILSFNIVTAEIKVQDDFNRADGALGTATNGNTWTTAGTTPPTIESNQAKFVDGGTNPSATLLFNVAGLANNIYCLKLITPSSLTNANNVILKNGTTTLYRVEFINTGARRVTTGATTYNAGTWSASSTYKVCFTSANSTYFNFSIDSTNYGTFKNVGSATGFPNTIFLESSPGTTLYPAYFDLINASTTDYSIIAKSTYNNTAITAFTIRLQNKTTTKDYYVTAGTKTMTFGDKRKYNITFYNNSNYANRTYYNYNFSLSGNLIGYLNKNSKSLDFYVKKTDGSYAKRLQLTEYQSTFNFETDGNVFVIEDSDGICLHNPESGSETVTCASDTILKTNIIEPTTTGLTQIDKYDVKEYTVIESGDTMVGVIAQDLVKTSPELTEYITFKGEQILGVKLPSIWDVVTAIQELKKYYELQNTQIVNLQTLTTQQSILITSLNNKLLLMNNTINTQKTTINTLQTNLNTANNKINLICLNNPLLCKESIVKS